MSKYFTLNKLLLTI